MLPVWAGEMLAKINLSVSLLRDFDEGCAHKKVDARGGSFSRGPRLR